MSESLVFEQVFREVRTHEDSLAMVIVEVYWNGGRGVVLFQGQVFRRYQSDHEWSSPEVINRALGGFHWLGAAARQAVSMADEFYKKSFAQDDQACRTTDS